MALLETQDLTIRFGGHAAVDGVSCTFAPGTLTAIVGPNGAGKTTFFNLVSGQLRASAGQVRWDGADVTRLPASARARRGIGRAFQLTNLFPALSVRENVRIAVQSRAGIGLDLLRRAGAHRALGEETEALLARVNLARQAEAKAAALPHGDQRKLEVAMMLALRPRVFMFDEPTAGMSVDEVPVILDLIRAIKAEPDRTILLVEHKMDVVRSLADRIVVLHNGRLVADGAPAEVIAAPVVQEAYLGVVAGTAADPSPAGEGSRARPNPPSGTSPVPLLALAGVHTHVGPYHLLHGVDLAVPDGGVTALLGRNGAGKTTALRTVMGLWRASAGSIRFDGREIADRATPDLARDGIAYVPENMGVFADLTVRENLVLAARAGPADPARLEWVLDLFPALRRFWGSPAGVLSGGQKQMLSIARAVIEPRRLLLVDEPTKGLAPAIITAMIEAFAALKRDGATILLVEQNFGFARSLADTVAVMDDGRVVHAGRMDALAADPALQARLLGLALDSHQ